MAVLNATTTAQIITQIIAAAPNDEIAVAPGNYVPLAMVRTAGTVLNKTNVKVRPQDVNNPPNFIVNNGGQVGWNMAFVNGLTVEGMKFTGTPSVNGTGGLQYPTASAGLWFERCNNYQVRHCTVSFFRLGIVNRFVNGVTLWYNDFKLLQIDTMRFLETSINIHIEGNILGPHRIDPALVPTADNWHSDSIQFARRDPNPASTDIVIRKNYFTDPDPAAAHQGVFFAGPYVGAQPRHQRVLVEDNFMINGKFGWAFKQTWDLTFRRNCTRTTRLGNTPANSTRLRLAERLGGTIHVSNNVFPTNSMGVDLTEGVVGVWVNEITAPVLSNVAFPVGFTELIPYQNVGPYTDGAVTPPDPPAQPTDGSATGHGRIGTSYETEFPGAHSGVLIIRNDAPAFAAVGNDPAKLRWRNPTLAVNTPRPFRVGTPATNAAGSTRWEMRPENNLPLNLWTTTAGNTYDGIEWSYTADGVVWSDWSSYTGAFTAPGTPPPPTLDALTAGQWEFVGDLQPVFEGLFTRYLRITPTGPTFNSVQWDRNGDGLWRPLVNMGLDEDNMIIWQLQPLIGGDTEHLVGYEEVSGTIRLRYSQNETFSPPSVDNKTFTGPEDPPPVSPFDPGVRATISSALATLNGQMLVVPPANHPVVITDDTLVVGEEDGIITVIPPISPPIGAVAVTATYNGKTRNITTGPGTFLRKSGETPGTGMVTVRGVNAAGVKGPDRYFYI